MVAKRIMARINEPISFQGATILPGASAGIAVYPVDADNANDLVVHADLALYSAKKLGGGAFSFFSEELRRELEHRKQLEHDLRVAIAESRSRSTSSRRSRSPTAPSPASRRWCAGTMQSAA